MSKKICIVLVGGPCSGKSSAGKLAAEKLGIDYISSGDIAREMAKNNEAIKNDLDNGNLAPEDNMRASISNRLHDSFMVKGRDAVILDGFPRFGEQAEWLRNELPLPIDIRYVLFYAPLSAIIERSANRGRSDDKSLAQRLGYYYNVTYYELCGYINATIDTTEISINECSVLLAKFIREVVR